MEQMKQVGLKNDRMQAGPWYEEVLKQIDGHVLQSNIRVATVEEIEQAKELHKQGKCPHTIVIDEYGWLYDMRSCYTCGKGLGIV